MLDTVTEVYVWIGNKSNQEQRKVATAFATELLNTRKNRPKWVTVTKIIQNTGLKRGVIVCLNKKNLYFSKKSFGIGARFLSL